MLFLILLLELLFADAFADACRNGGTYSDGTCSCVNGYTGNHCQIEPDNVCVVGNVKVNLDTQVVINSVGVEKCTDHVSIDCYATPWSRTFTGPTVTSVKTFSRNLGI